jgi:MYXO-CTERM domain-containing protein
MKRLSPFSLAALLALGTLAAPAAARPFRVSDIPNGDKNTCLNCHGDTKASYNTDFGSDARNYLEGSGVITQLHVNWTPLCPLDSDGDGWTNGQELGDPDCTWKVGDPNPVVFVTNPGDPASFLPPTCGNGKLEAGEACEGTALAKTNCAEEFAGEGLLACTAQCNYDYSGCSKPPSSSTGGGPPLGEEEGGCSAAGAGAPARGGVPLGVMLGLALLWARRRQSSRDRAILCAHHGGRDRMPVSR